MKKVVLASLFLLGSCNSMGSAPIPQDQRLVLTARSSVRDEPPPVEFMTQLPIEATPKPIRPVLGLSETNPPVLVEHRDLKPQTTVVDPNTGATIVQPAYVPVEELLSANTYENDGWLDVITSPEIGGVIGGIAGGIPGAAPYLLGFEALLALLSRRKRQHYATAAKSAVHLNVKDTAVSLVKALGAAHTTPEPVEAKAENPTLNG